MISLISSCRKGCCEKHFKWSEDCAQKSELGGDAMGAATVATTSATVSTAQATFANKPLTSPTLNINAAADDSGEFYPVFSSGSTVCRHIDAGRPPSWMTGSYLKSSKSGCCKSYAFEWDYDKW